MLATLGRLRRQSGQDCSAAAALSRPRRVGYEEAQHAYRSQGGALWVAICVFAGVLLGEVAIVKQNFSLVVLAIIFVSILPMLVEAVRHRRTVPQ